MHNIILIDIYLLQISFLSFNVPSYQPYPDISKYMSEYKYIKILILLQIYTTDQLWPEQLHTRTLQDVYVGKEICIQL